MSNRKTIAVLVPNCNGGIDRLFDQVSSAWRDTAAGYRITIIPTHGRSMFGQSVLPFNLVYKSSALFFMVFVLPFRLLKFFINCMRGAYVACHINLSTGGSTIRKNLFGRICRLFDLPYFIHLHGGSYPEYFAALPPGKKQKVQQFYRNAARVVVLGNVWREFVVQTIGVSRDKVVILPNAVAGPPDWPEKPQATPTTLLFLGRLIPAKGTNELIQALADKRLRALPWTAVIAGDGELVEFRRRINDDELGERVSVPGWIDADGVAKLLEQSTIFVLPSHVENLPLSMLEAMAYGVCPIVTPVGAVSDVIRHEQNGLLIPVRDARALADALVMLLQDPDLCKKLANQAREDFLQNYDIRDYQRKLEHVYQEALVP